MNLIKVSISLFLLFTYTNEENRILPVYDSPSNVEITYLYHSGWLVETSSHILIFDYIPNHPAQSGEKDLVSIPESKLTGKPLLVFVTHQHEDHFSPSIFEWRKINDSIKYIFGWNYEKSPVKVGVIEPNENMRVENVEISTINSTDLGVGFVVQVDGITLFHAGDHARWSSSGQHKFEAGINIIARDYEKIDIVFLPIATGRTCETTESIREGFNYSIEKLQPILAFPMHIMCTDQMDKYQRFVESLDIDLSGVTIKYPSKYLDTFTYESKEN